MKGTVREMRRETGLGRVELDDGRSFSFDVSVCNPDVPDIGAEVEVTLGPSRLGGERVTRVVVAPSWDAEAVPALIARFAADRGKTYAQVAFVGRDGRAGVSDVDVSLVGTVEPGDTGTIELQTKKGFASARELRFGPFSAGKIDERVRERLVEAFLAVVKDDFEDWDNEDGCHCLWHRTHLEGGIAAARLLGASVDRLLPLPRWDDEADPDVRDRHS